MTRPGLAAALAKMREAGVEDAAIACFTHYYDQLEQGITGVIPEDSITPLLDPPQLPDEVDPDAGRAALGKTVLIKLNGGLGTSMGLDRAKTLLPVRDGRTFLDLIVAQVRWARREYDVRLPVLFMNSFRTSADCLAALAGQDDLVVDGLPLDFRQSQIPKLRADDLHPVSWPADPSLEWCPPGHGDIYPSLLSSGILERLLEAGFRYASSSNADNLGAAPDARVAAWFAASGAPYAAELCRRTAADRKGGHLAIRRADGQLILRDTAQTAAEEMHYFTDEFRHPYFHTNNLWFDLERLHATLTERDSVLGLPLIRNEKTVDPTDPDSPAVVQAETALGAAIEVFEGAQAVVVPRSRFLPVKTCNDLALLRSDAYGIGEDGIPHALAEPVPLVDLDTRHYRTVAQLSERFPEGMVSLREARSLTVRGRWTFGADVRAQGAVTLTADDGADHLVAAGTVLTGEV